MIFFDEVDCLFQFNDFFGQSLLNLFVLKFLLLSLQSEQIKFILHYLLCHVLTFVCLVYAWLRLVVWLVRFGNWMLIDSHDWNGVHFFALFFGLLISAQHQSWLLHHSERLVSSDTSRFHLLLISYCHSVGWLLLHIWDFDHLGSPWRCIVRVHKLRDQSSDFLESFQLVNIVFVLINHYGVWFKTECLEDFAFDRLVWPVACKVQQSTDWERNLLHWVNRARTDQTFNNDLEESTHKLCWAMVKVVFFVLSDLSRSTSALSSTLVLLLRNAGLEVDWKIKSWL